MPSLRSARRSTRAHLALIASLSLLVSLLSMMSACVATVTAKPLALLVPVRTTENISVPMREAFDAHLRAQLKERPELSALVELADIESTKRAVQAAACGKDCGETKAVVAIAKASSARFVFVAEMDNEDEIYSIKLRLFDGAVKKLYKAEESCEFCNEGEVKDKLTVTISTKKFLEVLSTPDAAAEAPAAKPATFPISVVSSPDNAKVLINGSEVGPTPLQLELDAGTYTLRVTAAGYVAEDRVVDTATLSSNAPLSLSFTLRPEPPSEFQLTLQSVPPGATCYLDGEALSGQTPITLKVKPGPHSARFELAGHEPMTQEFTTPNTPEDLLVSATLKASAPVVAPPVVAPSVVTPPAVTPPAVTPPAVTPPAVAPPSTPSASSGRPIQPFAPAGPRPALLSGGAVGGFVGGGVVLAGLGTWLIFKHGDLACTDGRNRFTCPDIYSTRGAGVPLLAAGALSMGVGLAAAILSASWPESEADQSALRLPTLTPTPGGAAASWGFRF